MACCGLCRPKLKSTIKTKKNITRKKVNKIDMWIENIEGPYESITLPTNPPNKPKTRTNKEEIAEVERSYQLSESSVATEQDKISQNDNVVFDQYLKNGRQDLQYLSSDISTSEDVQSEMSSHGSVNKL